LVGHYAAVANDNDDTNYDDTDDDDDENNDDDDDYNDDEFDEVNSVRHYYATKRHIPVKAYTSTVK